MESSSESYEDNYENEAINTDTYMKYERKWNLFADLCENNNILAKNDWSCCNNCGGGDMYREKDRLEKEQPNKKYLGYVFYHVQTTDNLYDDCMKSKSVIKVYLGWGYFDESNEKADDKCIKLAEKIHKLASDVCCDLEYTDISEKLLFVVNII
jgi:hypothetical protein